MNLLAYSSLWLLIDSTYAFNYLVLSPSFGHSHSTFMGKIADTLTDAGHNVTVLTLMISAKFRNVSYTESTRDVVYIETTEQLKTQFENMENDDFSRYWVEEGSMLETIPSYLAFLRILERVYENFRQNIHVLDELKHNRPKYDAIFFESFMFMGKAAQEYLDIPLFLPVTSVTHDNIIAQLIGEPVNPSYLSGYFTNFGNIMTFKQRLMNTISFVLGKLLLKYPPSKTLQDPTKTLELESVYHRAPFTFINSNPYIDFPRPLLPKTIQVGGITVNVSKLRSSKVDENWNKILEKRPYNLLVSFGTMFRSMHMPLAYKQNFVKVMTSFENVTFIFKYELEDVSFANEAENIIFKKWIPQTALLADSRVSAFFTHGGLGSVNELSYLGKPAILCPLFADQLRNAKMLTRHNGSIEISKFDLANYDSLKASIEKILFDKSYTENAMKLAKRLENQPVKPRELLVKHAEFAAQFGEQSGLDCNIRTMSFIEYFLLDVISFLVMIALLAILVVYLVIRTVGQLLCRLKLKRD